jgi:hypothetical protein
LEHHVLRPLLATLITFLCLSFPIPAASAATGTTDADRSTPLARADTPPPPADPTAAVHLLAEQEIARRRAAPDWASVPALAALRVSGEWAVVEVYHVPKQRPQATTARPELWLARRVSDDWQLILPGMPDFPEELRVLPDTLLDPLARQIMLDRMLPAVGPSGARALAGYRLPWPAGEAAYVTQPYAEHGLGQVDFWIPSTAVVAAKAGEVVYVNDDHTLAGCSSEFARYNNVVVVRHAADEYSLYLHVAAGTVPQAIKDRLAAQGSAPVAQGELIARQGNVGYTCGSDGKHLHLSTAAGYFVYQSPDVRDEDGDGNRDEPVFTAWARNHHAVDFVEASYEQLSAWPFDLPIISQNRGDPCAGKAPRGVVLFDSVRCGDAGEPLASETPLIDLPARGWNDRIRAIFVTPGWSVRVYAHVARLGASRCLDATTPDFGPLTFDGGVVTLDRNISSLQVFQSGDCTPAPLELSLAAAPAPVVDPAGRFAVTFTLATTGVVDARMTQRTLAFAMPAGSPASTVTTTTAVDLLEVAGEATGWPLIGELPAAQVAAWWSQPPGGGQLLARFAGEDGARRPISATLTLPLPIDGCGDLGEWNGNTGLATPLLLDGNAAGAICPAGDVDYYRFVGAAGQSIAAWVEAAAAGTPLDASLSLLDGDGVTVLAASDDVPGTLDPLLTHVLPREGTYYLRVAGADEEGSQAHTYRLMLSSGAAALPPCRNAPDRMEPDDGPDDAPSIPVDGGAVTHTLHVAGDEDWFAFEAMSGMSYTVRVDARLIDPALALFAQDGTTQLAAGGATGSRIAQIEWQPPSDGRYYGRVSALDAQQAGCTTRYALSVKAQDGTLPQLSLLVDGGAPVTNRREVTLTLAFSDTGTGVGVMQLANESTLPSSGWAAGTPTQTWQLTPGDGIKTVYGRVRDRAGNLSQVVTGTIRLDVTPPAVQLSIAGGVTAVLVPQAAVQVETVADAVSMRFRVEPGEWGPWVERSSTFAVDLAGLTGWQRIDAQVRDAAGNLSAVSSLSIEVVTPVAYLPLVRR